jgi:choline monooxygenase
VGLVTAIADAARLDESLAAGATLPASWYSDPEILRLEEERIFARTWQYAGLLEDVAEPGSFLAATAGHIPVVVVRDEEGELRAFVNVCRHRGHLVAQGTGRRSTLQCPYHAWTYGLDGSLRNAPRCDREPGFDASDLSLLPVQVGTFGPLVLVNPDLDAPPLAETVGGLLETIAESGLDLGAARRRERVEWEIHANWKVTIENYLECYHCPTAHPGFSKVIDVDPDSYLLQAEGRVSSQFGPVRESALAGNGNAPYQPKGPVRQAQYHFVWPSLTMNIEPGPANISFDTWRAVSPTLTLGFSDYFFGEEVSEKEIEELVAFSTQVGNEDMSLVESVQRGLESGMVPQGRLLPQSEKLIQHFQRLVFDALAG